MTDPTSNHPRVEAIYIAAAAAELLQPLAEAELVAGVGITGDRYATRRGYWSDPRWPDQELTLVEAELEESLGLPLGALRRNIVTRGVDLSALLGRRFQAGEAIIEGVRPCDPCMHIEELNRPGLFRELAGRGGIRARILQDGHARPGDAITLLPANAPGYAPAMPHRLPSNKPPPG